MVNPNNKRVMITLPKKTIEKIEEYLDRSGMSFTQYIQFLIYNDMRKEER